MNKKVILIPVVLFIIVVSIAYYAPIDTDAGGCAGGFKKYLAETQNQNLDNLFEQYTGTKEYEDLSSLSETANNMSWQGSIITTKKQFIVKNSIYEVTYIGTRYWFEKYNWKIKNIKLTQ